jgi:hypothetical protein
MAVGSASLTLTWLLLLGAAIICWPAAFLSALPLVQGCGGRLSVRPSPEARPDPEPRLPT